MKQEILEKNWLADIGGLTVSEAIALLQELPQDHKLCFYVTFDGDLHSNLVRERPFTQEELADEELKKRSRKATLLKQSIAYNKKMAETWRKTATVTSNSETYSSWARAEAQKHEDKVRRYENELRILQSLGVV